MKQIKIILILTLFYITSYAPPQSRYWETYVIQLREFQAAERFHAEVLRIMHSIREIESNGRYHVRGLSGEYGAYQYMPATWYLYSIAHFGKLLDITCEENQDAVTFKKVSSLLQKGYTVEEVASFWNCGKIDWEGRIGVNGAGVKYNVPKYVNKFKTAYDNYSLL